VREIPVTDARERMADVLEEATSHPVYVTKRGRRVAVVISADEYERLLQLQEDVDDLTDAHAALARMHAGEPTIPWEQVKQDLGL
jgi:prevent-host-death family protein